MVFGRSFNGSSDLEGSKSSSIPTGPRRMEACLAKPLDICKYVSATVPSGTIVECSKVCLGFWDPGIAVLEIPEGFLRGQETNYSGLPGVSRASFFR